VAKNLFSHFTQPGTVRVSKFRRIRHSASNKIRSTKGSAKSAAGGALLSGAGYASSGATIATGELATASAGWGVAAGASAGTFALTVASGPVAAASLTMIGLVLTAKSAFSNRDRAHEKLNSGYVWTYIDDTRPTKTTIDKDAKEAATHLVMDGKSQLNIMADKLRNREEKWRAFVQKFDELTNPHMIWHNSFQRLKDVDRLNVANAVGDAHNGVIDFFDKAMASGGVGYEFMRRLVHAGNYVQSYRIFAKTMVGDNSPLEDFDKDGHAAKYRSELERLSERAKKAQEAGQAVENYLRTTSQNPIFQRG
jgi:hypothetical protein